MNALVWIDPSFSLRLTAALLHFLWQGCAIAALALAGGAMLRKAPAQWRYALHVAALLAMAACLPATLALVDVGSIQPAPPAAAPPAAVTPVSAASGETPHAAHDEHAAARLAAGEAPVEFAASGAAAPADAAPAPLADLLRPASPYLAAIYFACVSFMLARLAAGLWGGHRLRQSALPVEEERLLAMARRQAQRMGLRWTPAIAWCERISAPVVIGVARPMILLPAALVSGLSLAQLEAIVAHELAHIRRFDLAVNLLQRLIESALFFHPAVWLVSRRVSLERESAADDLVLAAGWPRLQYADALVRMAELSLAQRAAEPLPQAAALAASGKGASELKRRVLRLFESPEAPRLRLTRGGVLALALIAALTLAAPAMVQGWADGGHDQEPKDAPSAEGRLPDWLRPLHLHGLVATMDAEGSVVAIMAGEVMTDELLGRLKTLPKLRKLEIEVTRAITPDGLAHLADLSSLETLSLYGVNRDGAGLGDAALQSLAGHKRLRELRIAECGTTDAGAKWLERLPQLEHLELRQEGRLTDAALASVGKLKRLKRLDLTSYVATLHYGRMRFTEAGLRHLAGLQELEVLHIPYHAATAETLVFPRLKSLSLGGDDATDDCLSRVAECRELRSLELSYTRVTDEGLAQVARLAALKSLSLGSHIVTDEGIAHLTRLPGLERLELRASRLSDVSLRRLAEIKSLTSLSLHGSGHPGSVVGERFTMAGLRQLKALPNLHTLTLSNFQSSAGYRDLNELTQLRTLTLMMTDIRGNELGALQKGLPQTTIHALSGGGLLIPTNGLAGAQVRPPDELQVAQAEPAEQEPESPQNEKGADEPAQVTFVITKHVILHEGKIVTWDDVERILDQAAEKGKVYPQFYSTNGALGREEELRAHRWRLYEKLYNAKKVDGMSVGSLSPRAGERLDRIQTPADLAPDEASKLSGRVLGVDGEPLAGVEVFLLPESHINGVYLRDGRIRNPLEEHLTRTDAAGGFTLHGEEGERLIAAAHPNGFVLAPLDAFKASGRLTLRPWAQVSGKRPSEGPDAEQEVSFTCYPVEGISFHIYETEIAEDGSFDQRFVPPGRVIVQRSLSIGQGGSMSFLVEQRQLAPGQSHEVLLGPIPDADKEALKEAKERNRRE